MFSPVLEKSVDFGEPSTIVVGLVAAKPPF